MSPQIVLATGLVTVAHSAPISQSAAINARALCVHGYECHAAIRSPSGSGVEIDFFGLRLFFDETLKALKQLPGASTRILLGKRSTSYTVADGDTGDSISASYGITFNQLSAANPEANWYDLQIDQVLEIPTATSSTIIAGASSSSSASAAAAPTSATKTSIALTTTVSSSSTVAAVVSGAVTSSAATSTSVATPTIAAAPTSAASDSPAVDSSSQPAISSTSQVTGSLAVASLNDQDGQGALTDSYTFYSGDGSPAAGWPSLDAWESFEDMWTANAAVLGQNCDVFGATDNTVAETAQIRAGIEAIATISHLDHRFILATIMQESLGCVRAPTTNYGVRNPGLMQDHDGTGTCNDSGDIQSPCPETEIFQMIQDGAMGTAAGDGGVQVLSQAESQGGSGAQAFYMAARIYNSGSIDASGDLGAGIATHCYASDVANRLTGWVSAASKCTLD